ncbi:ABC transporter permease [Vermiphilus pyriformis]|uniref:ABC transporter permease n=1 Tax=candidate division TM6 bacterium JCVI TM6SC1 TaxID=1306947 RepID=A0A0D2JM28_9BACT|nr:hypothetical protein J120_00270 [candidate division TM6 bacterium JCVI TM6SC1]UNE34937.1 MAG: ABC transporter permease [Vermiphilus pyriformis]
MLLSQVPERIGTHVVRICNQLGTAVLFLYRALVSIATTAPKLDKLLEQMGRIGVESFYIVALTGLFAGMVLCLQLYIAAQRFAGDQFVSPALALGIIRELGPVFTGLMVSGRAGSAIAAELGTMQISEQIDALKTLQIDPFRYLIAPRIVASTFMLPLLGLFCMICGIIGGWIVYVAVLGLNSEVYLEGIKTVVTLKDITGGLTKCAVFGLILAWIGCYKGYITTGGAKGVGINTTATVVTSSILILASNYFLTKLLESL